MPHESLLIGLSQIGAVFAGFMALFIALAQRDGRLDPVSALRARSILHTSVMTIVISLLPLVLTAAEFEVTLALRVSAGMGAVTGLALSFEGARHQSQLTSEQKKSTGLMFNLITWGLTGIAFLNAIGIAAGIIDTAFYTATIFLIVLVSALNFVKISLERWL